MTENIEIGIGIAKSDTNFTASTTSVKFKSRHCSEILKDSEKINVDLIADEILTWLINNVETYVDTSCKVFKLDLVLDENLTTLTETKKLQELFRSLADANDEELGDGSKYGTLENVIYCRNVLNEITERAFNSIQAKTDLLTELFKKLKFYYEKLVITKDKKEKADQIDAELKSLAAQFENSKETEDKDSIKLKIIEKIQEGKNLLEFEDLQGFARVVKFEYEAFSVGVRILEGEKPAILDEYGNIVEAYKTASNPENPDKKEVLKQYVIPECFVVWVEIALNKKNIRPVSLF